MKALPTSALTVTSLAKPRNEHELDNPYPKSFLKPLPRNMPDTFYDGAIIGEQGKAYEGPREFESIPRIDSIPTIKPNTPGPCKDLIVYINGANTSYEEAYADGQHIADTNSCEVLIFYMARRGTRSDYLEVFNGRRKPNTIQNSNAASTYARYSYSEFKAGQRDPNRRKVHTVAYSRGTMALNNGLRQLLGQLKAEDISKREARRHMKDWKMETLASVAYRIPKCASFENWFNVADWIAYLGPRNAALGGLKHLFKNLNTLTAGKIDKWFDGWMTPEQCDSVTHSFFLKGETIWKTHSFRTYWLQRMARHEPAYALLRDLYAAANDGPNATSVPAKSDEDEDEPPRRSSLFRPKPRSS